MVSTQLKNISQIGNLPQIGVKIKNIWNHQPENLIKTQSIYFANKNIFGKSSGTIYSQNSWSKKKVNGKQKWCKSSAGILFWKTLRHTQVVDVSVFLRIHWNMATYQTFFSKSMAIELRYLVFIPGAPEIWTWKVVDCSCTPKYYLNLIIRPQL